MTKRYADQRAHDVTWMTAAERDELEREREAAEARLARARAECEARRAAAPPVPRPAYGWCAYCPAYTYRDLNRGPDGSLPGACADCVARWREFPQTCPPNRREAG